MRYVITSALLLLCASCAQTVKTPPMIVTTPPKAASAAPFINLARRDANAATALAVKLDAQVSDLKKSTTSLKDGMAKVTAETKRIIDSKVAATEAELSSVYTVLASNNEKVVTLLEDVQTAWDLAGQQRDLRVTADENGAQLAAAVANLENENSTLRLQRTDIDNLVKLQREEINSMTRENEKSQKNAALGSYVKWAIGIAIVSFVGLTIFKLIIAGAIPKISS